MFPPTRRNATAQPPDRFLDSAVLSALLTFAGGLLGVTIAAALAHRYTLGRERRAELTRALDAAVASFTAGDHALMQFLARVESADLPSRVQEAADRVSHFEIDIRSAMFSMRLRLSEDHPVSLALASAHEAFTASYMACEPAMHYGVRGDEGEFTADQAVESLREAYGAHEAFRSALDSAMAEGRQLVGTAA